MTTPDVPLRLELTAELPGTPEQVWAAVATGSGISLWFLPTDVEEREGGKVVTHMGEAASTGTVTVWDPPRRFAYAEPDWAPMVGQADAEVSPLTTEFRVEPQPGGGGSFLHLLGTATGTGAEWERQAFDDMAQGWRPYLERLRLYLRHFAGRPATPLGATATLPGSPTTVLSTIRNDLGLVSVGEVVEVRGLTAQIEQLTPDVVLLRLTAPVPGFLGFVAFDRGDGTSSVTVQGQLFSDDAAGFVEREQPAWQAWLQGLEVPVTGQRSPLVERDG